MAYDDRSVKPMSASLMRARIATKILSGLYEDAPTLLTSAIRLTVELPGGSAHSGPPYPFTIGVSPAWCSGLNGAKLVASGKLDLVWLNPSIIPSMAVRGVGPFRRKYPLRAAARPRSLSDPRTETPPERAADTCAETAPLLERPWTE